MTITPINLTGFDHPAMQELNLDHIEDKARSMAQNLALHDWGHTVLTPDDDTRYEIVITRNTAPLDGHASWVVASNLATVYGWNGEPTVHPHYAHTHYGDCSWTGVVMALFLNAVAVRLKEGVWV